VKFTLTDRPRRVDHPTHARTPGYLRPVHAVVVEYLDRLRTKGGRP
jgi:hypothetical protein